MVRYVATTEPEWDEYHWEMMRAFQDYEGQLHTCGHPLSESTSLLADPDNPDGEWVYTAQLPIRCHACTALEQAKKPYEGKNYDPARMFVVDKVMRVQK